MTNGAYNEVQVHAGLTARDDVQWADPRMDLPSTDLWPRAETAPHPGSEASVRVYAGSRAASIGDELWTLFRPALSALNGWDEYPAEIVASAFVLCQVLAVELSDPSRGHWLRAGIIEVIRLAELNKRFPGYPLPELAAWRLSTGSLTCYGDWELWFAPHDDAGFGKQHDRSKFFCGQAELDDWFRRRPGQDERRNVARVFIAVDSELGVVGFYSLSAFKLELDDLLVADAVRRILGAAQALAVLATVVDAKDERAATFYEGLGFRRFPLHPNRLFLLASSAVTALERM